MRCVAALVFVATMLLIGLPVQAAPQDVLTQHNDPWRTGAALAETTLNVTNVRSPIFGKLYTRSVDGDVYAQPLYVSGVDESALGLGIRNLLIVATARNNLYAFDASDDDPNPQAGLLWGPVNFGVAEPGRPDINGNGGQGGCPSASSYGIIATPVVDRTTNSLYIVTKSMEVDRPHQRLHRLDLRTGREVTGSPVEIDPDPFNANHIFQQQISRAGLLLSGGLIYVGFAGHCDGPRDFTAAGSYHGWVVGLDAATLKVVAAFNTTPDDYRGGVWQSGNGLSADENGRIFFNTGNRGDIGDTTPTTPPKPVDPPSRNASDFSQRILRLNPNLTRPASFPGPGERLAKLDYFWLDSQDLDIASSGPLLTPFAHGDLITGGKTGRIYVIDRDTMGLKQTFRAAVNMSAISSGAPNTPETCVYGPDHYEQGPGPIPVGGTYLCPHIHAGPVWWRSGDPRYARLYLWSERDYLRSYRYDMALKLFVRKDGTPLGTADDLSAYTASDQGPDLMPLLDPGDGHRVMPGPALSLSANGNNSESGIIWATMVLRDNAEYKNVYGVLRAFDATTLRELWNSGNDQYGVDFLGKHAKFAAPTIANGTVYVATSSNRIVAYGLLGRRRPSAGRWQEWGDIGQPPMVPGAVRIIPAGEAVTILARDAAHEDLYLCDVNRTVLNAGFWSAGATWHPGYPITSSDFCRQGSSVGATSRNASDSQLFAVRPDGSIWLAASWPTSPTNLAWNVTGVPLTDPGFVDGTCGQLTAVARSPQNVDVFAVRADGSVWLAAFENDSGWHRGFAIPGVGGESGFASRCAAVSAINRTSFMTDLYAIRSNGSLWNAGYWVQGANGNNWQNGYAIPGAAGTAGFTNPEAAVAASARTTNDVDLAAVRADGSVWMAASWNVDHWTGGYPMPGVAGQPRFANVQAGLAIVNRIPTATDLYVSRIDGTLWNAGYWLQGANGNRWQPGYKINSIISVSPSATVPSSARVVGVAKGVGHVDLFVTGTGGQVFDIWWDAGVP
jgi:hypothetical protein